MPTPTLAEVLAAGNSTGDNQITGGAGVQVSFNADNQIVLVAGNNTLTFHDDGTFSIGTPNGASVSSGDGVGLLLVAGDTGLIALSPLPTTDPAVAGALWNDNGSLKVSAG